MKWFLPIVTLCALAVSSNYAAPVKPVEADAESLKQIQAKMDKLERNIAALRRQGLRDPFLAEIEIYYKAADWIVRHKQFYQKDSVAWTLEALDRGLLRSTQQAGGEAPWLLQRGHPVVRAYRSRLDNSVQPYVVTFPEDYARDPSKKWRVDVVLHGRGDEMTEVSFLHQFNGDKAAPKRDYVQIDIFGRTNNAYRWAGEVDVGEAVDAFMAVERGLRREQLIDPARMVLRGFSMGGAGTWHLGLHRPDRWAVLGPGAGFTVTKGYAPNTDEVPDYVEKCWHIYDARDYAENVFNVPVVAYSGEKDKQIAAARNIEDALKGTKLSITHLIAPELEHKFPPEWQAKAETEYARHVAKGRFDYAKKVRFVTYTLKYQLCDWVEILGLDEHYKRTVIEAEQTDTGYTVTTANVRTFHLGLPPGSTRQELTVKIDNETLTARPHLNMAGEVHLYCEKKNGRWQSVLPQKVVVDRVRTRQKMPGMQGPIDDAFMHPFLCVRGTGKPWHAATQDYADKNLKRFVGEWDRWFRGKLLVKDDTDVTAEDLALYNLILFGDPSSNSLIAQIIDNLPLEWNEKTLALGGKKVDAATHVPALIYPSPLHTERYVVLNSGHTFHAKDFEGTNALLYPRLGDYALLKIGASKDDPLAVDVVEAGLFDEFWHVRKK